MFPAGNGPNAGPRVLQDPNNPQLDGMPVGFQGYQPSPNGGLPLPGVGTGPLQGVNVGVAPFNPGIPDVAKPFIPDAAKPWIPGYTDSGTRGFGGGSPLGPLRK
jgi:hypothetical protein